MITPKIIFETLQSINIINSKLSYDELKDSRANILIKVKNDKGTFYHVDLLQNLINLNNNYQNPDDRPEWIYNLLDQQSIGLSLQINDATIYKNINDFNEYLTSEYAGLVDDFLNQSPEKNYKDYGSTNPFDDFSQRDITIISDYQLKKELKKYNDNSLANHLEKTYQHELNKLEKHHKKAINKAKQLATTFDTDERFNIIKDNPNVHNHINKLMEIIDLNFSEAKESITHIPLPNKQQYSTEHIKFLY